MGVNSAFSDAVSSAANGKTNRARKGHYRCSRHAPGAAPDVWATQSVLIRVANQDTEMDTRSFRCATTPGRLAAGCEGQACGPRRISVGPTDRC